MASKETYAAVYDKVIDIFCDHYDKITKPSLNSVYSLTETYRKSGNELFKTHPDFPVAFYQDLALVTIRWSIDKFKNILEMDTITGTFQVVKDFHNKYTNTNSLKWDDAVNEAVRLVEGHPRYIERLFLAVLDELERTHKVAK